MSNLKLPTSTPSKSPERGFEQYTKPFTRLASTHASENPVIKPLHEAEYNRLSTSLQAEKRGVEYATQQVQLAESYVKLDTARVKLGTTKLSHAIALQGFQKTAFDLVKARAETAISHDNAVAKVVEHGVNQSMLTSQHEARQLALGEIQAKNEALRAKGGAIEVPRLRIA